MRESGGSGRASSLRFPDTGGAAPLTERLPMGPYSPVGTVKTAAEVNSLGVSLAPSLHEACGDRLGTIEWFQSPWQRSGAATGYSTWRLPDGSVIEAVVKAPVGYREWFWATSLGEADPMRWNAEENRGLPVPRVLSSSLELGGYDIAWLVLERVRGRAVSRRMDCESLVAMFEAAAQFEVMTTEVRTPASVPRPAPPDWAGAIERAAKAVADNAVADRERWLRAIAGVERRLDSILREGEARKPDSWCHGDLHPGNVVSRRGPDGRLRCVLLDLALVRPGSWVEDAVYVERLHWGREELLAGVDPVTALGEARTRLGLPTGPSDLLAADRRRLLLATTAPLTLAESHDEAFLAAALAKTETLLASADV
ncbi:MAG: aminoglycoside phosphotransferase family protein [Planctomycetota bacterium]